MMSILGGAIFVEGIVVLNQTLTLTLDFGWKIFYYYYNYNYSLFPDSPLLNIINKYCLEIFSIYIILTIWVIIAYIFVCALACSIKQ